MTINRIRSLIFLIFFIFSMSVVAQENVIELNTADIQTLCSLPGIGPKKAKAIVDYRIRRPFTRVTQLVQVKGIGRKTLKNIRNRIKVEPIFRNRKQK